MRRAFGILIVSSLALLMPVIAQIGGRPMTLLVARVSGPAAGSAARFASAPNGPVNAEMTLRALNILEGANQQVTHAAIYFQFRVVPPPPPTPNALISIEALGPDANIQNQQFIYLLPLSGGKGSLLIFRARALRYDNNNPPNQVEQQGTVILMIQDRAPSASQRPNPNAQPDQIAVLPGFELVFPAGLIYLEGQYMYLYNGVVRQGDIYTHARNIPEEF
ncbi:hypothetical protein HRbin15_02183 [bacterium HR15]|nr:hypothetical protein HRbin15_02183 [bacterium HR15]